MRGPPLWVERYIGIPFTESGYGKSGCHCWGLVCLVFKQEIGIELPRYDVIACADLRGLFEAFQHELAFGPWCEVADQQAYDVVLMRSIEPTDAGVIEAPAHFGIAAGAGFVLHVEEGSQAVCIDRRHYSIAGRRLGLYRHRDVP
jgi:cell wall-associated NlpC family hydrolase